MKMLKLLKSLEFEKGHRNYHLLSSWDGHHKETKNQVGLQETN